MNKVFKTKLSLISLILMLCGTITAQQENYAFYEQKIDSLTQEYAILEYKRTNEVPYFFHGFQLNDKETEMVINKLVKLYEQESYVNLQMLSSRLLSDLFNNTNRIFRQRIIEVSLEHYFYPWQSEIISRDTLDYSPKAKILLHEVLQEKDKKENWDKYFNLYVKSNLDNKYRNESYYLKDAKQILGESANSILLNQTADSLWLNSYAIPEAKQALESDKITDRQVRLIGFLEMKECIPDLRKALQEHVSSKQLYGEGKERALREALVRLGDKEQEDFLIQNAAEYLPYEVRQDLNYMRSPRVIWGFIDYNRNNTGMTWMFSDEGSIFPMRSMSIWHALAFVKNPPKELISEDKGLNSIEEFIQYHERLYEWMVKNKESIEYQFFYIP